MTYIVNESCIKCKLMDCVEVCPVDCFYEGENMLVIHPDECIDCGVCEPECPVEAIKPDTEPGAEKWLSINAQYARLWPNITLKKDPPPTRKSGSSISSGDFFGGLTPLASGMERRSGGGGVLGPSEVMTVSVGRLPLTPRGRKSWGPPSMSSRRGLGPRMTRRSPFLASMTP